MVAFFFIPKDSDPRRGSDKIYFVHEVRGSKF